MVQVHWPFWIYTKYACIKIVFIFPTNVLIVIRVQVHSTMKIGVYCIIGKIKLDVFCQFKKFRFVKSIQFIHLHGKLTHGLLFFTTGLTFTCSFTCSFTSFHLIALDVI